MRRHEHTRNVGYKIGLDEDKYLLSWAYESKHLEMWPRAQREVDVARRAGEEPEVKANARYGEIINASDL